MYMLKKTTLNEKVIQSDKQRMWSSLQDKRLVCSVKGFEVNITGSRKSLKDMKQRINIFNFAFIKYITSDNVEDHLLLYRDNDLPG